MYSCCNYYKIHDAVEHTDLYVGIYIQNSREKSLRHMLKSISIFRRHVYVNSVPLPSIVSLLNTVVQECM